MWSHEARGLSLRKQLRSPMRNFFKGVVLYWRQRPRRGCAWLFRLAPRWAFEHRRWLMRRTWVEVPLGPKTVKFELERIVSGEDRKEE